MGSRPPMPVQRLREEDLILLRQGSQLDAKQPIGHLRRQQGAAWARVRLATSLYLTINLVYSLLC